MDEVPVTKVGLKKLREQLAEYKARRPAIQTAIQVAREKGDLSENAEFHAAREELSLLENKIADLEDRISRARVIEIDENERDIVRFMAKVTVHDIERDIEETYQLVGSGEDDIIENKILATSPMAEALLGKQVGDQVEVPTPTGTDRYKITKIEYD